ncbi:purine-nucleoside phosphorylase [Benzoatithermus flavus]|uniref:Cytidine deaminase n=1 Tax=Benzoatithermus flavus TaxID=3108223 RepID=A0ABU8XQ21_9PROT
MSPDELFQAARAAREHAYAPYSRFAVGAAIRTASGRIFTGCNVENAAYPQGQCAEATAVGAMAAAGERVIAEVAVAGSGEALCSPCGGCRQRLVEFGRPDTPVHLGGPEGIRLTVTLGELLPYAFGGHNLGKAGAAGADAAAVIRARVAGRPLPMIGIVLGSGLSGIAEQLASPLVIDYRDLPGFPRPSVEGHAGRLVLGTLASVPVVCLAGRAHFYEGGGAGPINTMVRTLRAIGCKAVLLTNAAGSLRPDLDPGSIVLIEDHINLQGLNPLVGPNDERVGPRFVDLSEVYSRRLRGLLAAAAERLGIRLPRGVYLATLGPAFETPAEIRAFKALGADLVGMSTVPEAISARHAGLEVAGLSIVTNLAAGLGPAALTHAETLAHAAAAADRVGRLLEAALPEIALALA